MPRQARLLPYLSNRNFKLSFLLSHAAYFNRNGLR